ncbi:MAG: lamin tail domain-containing protein [Ignavibacteriaceae bacterium]
MKKSLLLFILIISFDFFPQQKSIININEIMFNPQTGHNEFVEVYNASESDSVDLNNFKFKYYSSTPNIITSTGFGTVLPPKSYAVILEGDYDFTNGIYNSIIPKNALILKIKENSFGSLGMANTIDRPVWLLNASDDTLDAYIYSANNDKGFSDEKILGVGDSSKSNWENSLQINGTPGFLNSVSPKESDLAVSDIIFNPSFPSKGESFTIEVKVQNNGIKTEIFSLQLFEDTNLDSLPDILLTNIERLQLAPDKSMILNSNFIVNYIQNKKAFYARVLCNGDQVQSNDYFYKTISPGSSASVILINEVMYNPTNGEPEWIEIYNTSSDSINLENWSVTDLLTTPATARINQQIYIPAKSFLVLVKDSSIQNYHKTIPSKIFILNIPVLNNDRDGVVLKDNRGFTIDSLFYDNSWGGTAGYSLERISLFALTNDSANWMTSMNESGSSPGQPNSVLEIKSFKKGDMVINEIMFDPAIDNSEFIELLNNSGGIINIGGWKIEDENKNYFKLSNVEFVIPPEAYFILSSDSAMIKKYSLLNYQYKNILNTTSLGLTNSGKLILLKDALGNTIDSVWYSPNWHNNNYLSTKNISLERVNPKLNGNDPLNWSSSADKLGATPSKQNSIFSINLNKSSKISVSPNPFSPDNDGFEDFATINYNLTQIISQIRIKIFDSRGRLVRTLVNNQASGSNGSVIFNGLDDAGNPLRIGIYVIFLEALNENFGTIENLKTAVVIARKLH